MSETKDLAERGILNLGTDPSPGLGPLVEWLRMPHWWKASLRYKCVAGNHPKKVNDGYPIENVGHGRLFPSSPPVVSGDPSERKNRWMPDDKRRE
jgi:hypothetical protein